MNKKMLLNPRLFLALGAGSGLSPKAPGTIGTLVTFPLYYACNYILTFPVMVIVAISLIVIGIPICRYADQQMGTHDSGAIVWDEIAAFFLVLVLIPNSGWWQGVAFVVFRFFDITKPPPINWLEKKVKGGLGIMLDDIVAALITIGLLQLATHFLN